MIRVGDRVKVKTLEEILDLYDKTEPDDDRILVYKEPQILRFMRHTLGAVGIIQYIYKDADAIDAIGDNTVQINFGGNEAYNYLTEWLEVGIDNKGNYLLDL